ncbi:MAG: hypothetical protein AB7G11_08190 [Phycisphaerales bacterium]
MSTRENGEQPEIGDLLRAAADGELSAQEAEHLRSMEADDHAPRIVFDQELRRACARVLRGIDAQAPNVPEQLRQRIQAIAVNAPAGAPAVPPVQVPRTHTDAGRSNRVPRTGRRRRSRLVWLSGAVCVLIVGVLVGVRALLPGPTFRDSPAQARIALVGFLESEHRRCTLDDRALKRKMTVMSLSEAPKKFESLIGGTLSVEAVEAAGYEFLGSGRCAVPGCGESVHMIFRDPRVPAPDPSSVRFEECDASRFSVFVQKDMDELPIVAGRTYRLETRAGEPLVAVWTRGGVLYYLVTESPEQEADVMKTMNVPRASEVL